MVIFLFSLVPFFRKASLLFCFLFCELSLLFYYLFYESSLLFHLLVCELSLFFYFVFRKVSLLFYFLFYKSSLLFYFLFCESSLLFHYLFCESSLLFHLLVCELSLFFHFVFRKVSLLVQILFHHVSVFTGSWFGLFGYPILFITQCLCIEIRCCFVGKAIFGQGVVFYWSEGPPQKVTSIDQIQQEQEREKKRQRRPQSQHQTASRPKGMYRADSERMYSVRPPLQARYLSFLSPSKENRGAGLKWCESALDVVISHDYRKDIEFTAYAMPKQYEQWTDPKVKLKLEAAEKFLQYWADYVQWYLENKERVPTIDEILDEYREPLLLRERPRALVEKVVSVAETPASREDKSTAKG